MKNRKKSMSLNTRLLGIALLAFVPVFVVLVYALDSLAEASNAYERITRSVTYANESADFKERMDYSMYLAVIQMRDFAELGNGEVTVNGIITVNPYESIEEMKERCARLADMATADINRNQIIRLHNTLESLEQSVQTLEEMIQETGTYEENMEYLEDNIYMLTEIIGEGLQDYIKVETDNLREVSLEQERQNQTVYAMGIVITALAVAATAVFVFRAFRSVTGPVQNLCDMTQKVAHGDFTAQAKPAGIDELNILTDSFNQMAGEIGSLVEDIKGKEKHLYLMETKLLQAQINPHFLYNTLDAIVWLAEDDRKEEAVAMVTSLSEFFRTTLAHGRDFVSVREEQSHIESYLKIQGFRYQDILEYEVEMDRDILDYTIPKLLLQPLVENALYHGVKNKRGKSCIRVWGYREGSYLVFKIIDNGKGMTKETLAAVRKNIEDSSEESVSESYGLRNINQRIRHYYGEEYGLNIESEENIGTEATITLPSKKNKPIT